MSSVIIGIRNNLLVEDQVARYTVSEIVESLTKGAVGLISVISPTLVGFCLLVKAVSRKLLYA